MTMSVEAVIPAAAAVAVSLVGFLHARFITFKYDRALAAENDAGDGPGHDATITVDLADVERSLSSQGINPGRLTESFSGARHKTIEIPIKTAHR